MNWWEGYKRMIYAGANPVDINDLFHTEIGNILSEYYKPSRSKGQQMSWDVIPFGKVKKIWGDFAKTGFVRDTGTMNSIADKMIRNLARLEAATQLAGHGSLSTEEECENYGFPVIDSKNADFYFDFLETKYGSPVSDYGLEPLWELGLQLAKESIPEKQLMLVDRMLQITHQRGDLAALFVEGGRASLLNLFVTGTEET